MIISASITAITQWPYWIPLIMTATLLFIIYSVYRGERKYIISVMELFIGFLSVFALYYLLKGYGDPIAGVFFFILAGIMGLGVIKNDKIPQQALRYTVITIALLLLIIIWSFSLFKHIYFRDQIYINFPFRLYFSGITQWSVLAVITISFLVFRLRNQNNPIPNRWRYICGVSLISFWTCFLGINILDKQPIADIMAFNPITQKIHLGSGIDAPNKYGETKLLKAVQDNDFEEVKRLVEAGANVNVVGGNVIPTKTPLMRAINRNYDIFVYLLKNGADLDVGYSDPNIKVKLYPIHLVRYGNGADNRFLEYLVSIDADLSFPYELMGRKGQRIHSAAEGGYNFKERKLVDNIAMLQFLLDHGIDIEAEGIFGTPLHHAIYGSNFEGVKFLVSQGADIYKKNNKNKTAFEMSKNIWKGLSQGFIHLLKVVYMNKSYVTKRKFSPICKIWNNTAKILYPLAVAYYY